MFSCNYNCLGMSQWANIRNVNSLVVKHYVDSKNDNLAYEFLKPEYPFKFNTLMWCHNSVYDELSTPEYIVSKRVVH